LSNAGGAIESSNKTKGSAIDTHEAVAAQDVERVGLGDVLAVLADDQPELGLVVNA